MLKHIGNTPMIKISYKNGELGVSANVLPNRKFKIGKYCQNKKMEKK